MFPHTITGVSTFVKRQEAASSFESPIGALDSSPGRRQRQEPLRPPWVSVLTNSYPLSQHLFRVGGRGRGWGPEGLDVEVSRFVPTNTATTTKRMIQD